MGGGGKGGGDFQAVHYRMSLHFGICSTVDAFRRIYVNEKLAWSGNIDYVSSEWVENLDLFGGNEKEGGVYGVAHMLPGKANQVLPQWCKDRLTGLPGIPEFRGVASIFFTGPQNYNETAGFMWSANVPYLRPVWVTVDRKPVGLNPDIAWVDYNIGTVNPAHMIFECMTNTEWGMGAPTTEFDIDNWNTVAQVLFNEAFGLAMKWDKQTSIEEFVNDILGHIEGSIVQNPGDLKYRLRLIRADYDINATKIVNKSNAVVQSFKRPAWGETINEVVVTWINPENEGEQTVSVQDLGNIAAQGAVVSDSRNYSGVRQATLADRLARRDLRTASSPLANAEVMANREFWDSVEGDVVRLDFPDYDAYMVPMRITKINYGAPKSAYIRMSLVEDVFAIPDTAYVPPGSAWQDPSEVPRAIPDELAYIISLPYALAMGAESNAVEGQEPLTYPQERAGLLATQTGSDTYSIALEYFGSDAAGNPGWYTGSRFTPLGHTWLLQALMPEVRTTMPIPPVSYGKTRYGVGQYMIIGAQANFTEASPLVKHAEIVLIESMDTVANTMTIRRGCLDTVPYLWEIGTPFWILNNNVSIVERTRIYADGSNVQFRLRTVTSKGMLPGDQANIETHIMRPRPFQPLRPTNVKINGQATLGQDLNITSNELVFTWSNRNRFSETSQPLPWDAPSVTPEPGQGTTVFLYNGDPLAGGVYVSEKTSTTDTATFGAGDGVNLATHWAMYSHREHPEAGFLTSFSALTGQFTVTTGGFGYDFGNNFGNAL